MMKGAYKMKLLRAISVFIFLLFLSSIANATTMVSVCGMPSSKTVQVRIYDITAVSLLVDWTSSGVSERADGQGNSCYYYAASPVTGHATQTDWKDNSSPVNSASEILPESSPITVTASSVTGSVASVTGNVGGNVVGTVGKSAMILASTDVTGNLPAAVNSITSSVDFTTTMKANLPTNFSLLSIDGSGQVATSNPGNAPTAAQVATAVWEDLLAGGDFGTISSIGKLLAIDIDTNIGSRGTSNYAGGAVASVIAAVNINSNADMTDIKTQVDKLTFDGSNNVKSNPQTNVTLAANQDVRNVSGTLPTVTLATSQPNYAPSKAGDAMALIFAYDAAKSAASQSSVNAIPTTPLLAANYTVPDNSDISAIKTTTDKVSGLIENISGNRFTAKALEEAPTGGSGGGATAAEIWSYNVSGYTTAGEAGTYLKAVGASGDPWASAVPGSYATGTAGYNLGHPDLFASLVLPPISGQIYTAVALAQKEQDIVAGDSPRVTFALNGTNCTGWTAEFAAKKNLTDTSYAIGVKTGTWIDASTCSGYFDLTSADTYLVGTYPMSLYGEVKILNGVQVMTGIKYGIKLLAPVIH